MLPTSFLQSSGFNTFDPGGPGALTQLAGALVPLWLILVVIVHVVVAWYIYSAAERLAAQGLGPALFPPLLWGLASLVGIFVVPFAFAVLHYATWSEPDVDVPWSRGSSRPRSGMMAEATELHHQRVAELREDLSAARGAHRRRYIRSKLREMEKDAPSPPSGPGGGPGGGPAGGPTDGSSPPAQGD